VSDRVLSNGRLLFVLEVHPLFLAIPLLCNREQELYPLSEFFIGTELEPLANLLCKHLPLVCKSIPFDDESIWALDRMKLMNWLTGRIRKLLPLFEGDDRLSAVLTVEMAWEAMKHFVRPELAESLKEHVREVFPGTFPVAEVRLNIAMDVGEPVESGKQKQAIPVKKPAAKKGAVIPAKKGLESYFERVKKGA
jgi:hypothetical protein